MNRQTPAGDLPEPVSRYFSEVSNMEPPTDLLDSAVTEMEGTSQGLRFAGVPMLGLAAAAVVIAVVVGVAALNAVRPPIDLGTGPTPTVSAEPTPAASTPPPPSPPSEYSTFHSTMHGISIDYPAGWQVRPATEPWTDGELTFDSPWADVIFDPDRGNQVYMALASRPAADSQDAQFALLEDAHLCGGGGGGSFKVDGASAFDWSCGSSEVAITTDGRGYLILFAVIDPGLLATYDSTWIEAELDSVDLRPEEAVDAPRPSP